MSRTKVSFVILRRPDWYGRQYKTVHVASHGRTLCGGYTNQYSIPLNYVHLGNGRQFCKSCATKLTNLYRAMFDAEREAEWS